MKVLYHRFDVSVPLISNDKSYGVEQSDTSNTTALELVL